MDWNTDIVNNIFTTFTIVIITPLITNGSPLSDLDNDTTPTNEIINHIDKTINYDETTV